MPIKPLPRTKTGDIIIDEMVLFEVVNDALQREADHLRLFLNGIGENQRKVRYWDHKNFVRTALIYWDLKHD